MSTIFILLFFASVVVLIAALIKPMKFKMKSRKQAGIVYGITTVVLFFLIGVANTSQQEAPVDVGHMATPTVNEAKTVQSSAPVAPLTDEQKIEQVVKDVVQQSPSHISFVKSELSADEPPAPQGSKYLTVTLDTDTASFWDDEAVITDTGKLSSQIFQKVFQANKNIYDVSVLYNGKMTDQYGNSKSSMVISHTMDRPLYSKINWSGFADLRNDQYLCAFLREEFNTMSQSDKESRVVGCAVLPKNFMQAENKIEASNPQFRDIPQYR